jgi:hypothetical protein
MGAVSRKSNRTINNGWRIVYQRCAMSAKSSYGLDRKLEPERMTIRQKQPSVRKKNLLPLRLSAPPLRPYFAL